MNYNRIYFGMWNNNEMNGYGEYYGKNNKKYFGFFKNNKKNGFGILFFENEKFFVGFWKNGKQNGIGKYINGELFKYGLWDNGIKIRWFNENEFVNYLDINEKKYLIMFNMDVNEIKNFMQIN